MIFNTKIQITDEGVMYDVPVNDELETLYADLPKDQQYWRRCIDFPAFFFDYDPHVKEKKRCKLNAAKTLYRNGKLVSLSVEDTIELIRLTKREKDRMTDGIYIMNNDEKIYFTGNYYGALQWGKMFGVKTNNGYGEHRECQRMLSYVHDLAVKHPELDGYYVHKIKKSGISQELSLFGMVETIVNKQFTSTVMSKVHTTAKSANFKFYLYGLKNLPPVLMPLTEQNRWKSAAQKIEMKCDDKEFSVENTYAAVPTTTDGLDGFPSIQRIHLDEAPKFPVGTPIEQVFTKSKEQARQQHTKIGIIMMSSYPPEEDTKAFFWCKNFYKECCKLNEEGLPINKMIAFCIGVLEGSSGTFDKFGKPDKAKAFAQEKAARDLCEDAYALQARKREYMFNAKEGWEVGGGGSTYNNIALTAQEVILEEMYLQGARNYIEGDLEWTAGRMSSVRFVPLTHQDIMKGKKGKIKLYCTLEYLEGKTNLCFTMPRKLKIINKERHYLLQPCDTDITAGGLDPVDYAPKSQMGVTQSMNACVIKDLQGNLMAVYYDRSEDPDENIDDFCMMMIFFNTYMLIEGNRKNAFTTIDKQGLSYFLLVRHPTGEILPYSEKVSIKPVSSTKDVIALYVSFITKRIKHAIGQFKDLKVIQQHKKFDPADTQTTDLSVADGLGEVALDAVLTWLLTKKNKSDKYAALYGVVNAVV